MTLKELVFSLNLFVILLHSFQSLNKLIYSQLFQIDIVRVYILHLNLINYLTIQIGLGGFGVLLFCLALL